ncbi:putative phospholipid-transporting ATPase IM isoform X1 [Phascolarctos cinereus]|uniref:Phospholipid-transporting ATPase n=1 Tax=Phascolarctos cinereus TaxID=38626 RepID=A0A6P5JMJ3_PHACI|nr:probable phospholipid-transporting ATPase IM isoform X1 [Phascolarctos cinereus]XP_020834533.1 probable phospholipid-transporting ATPase IM isoform X1 [Phascolarctos cinereus]XP_020834598.1 probable phospholipid-transporting ATPase IM isoform X1 [Phascolarctos cinereus]XP_020834667.1 probable phospholipid-transporting ATPase IM isoform X1 [Phascolarctos cinereus]XP_020834726.1 probable phospholipid-transporting ATPase IM isoform X1 [Phascolarctos cinereus]XP_020834814.1 probable phospholipi
MFCGEKKLLETERRVKANDREFNEKFQYANNRIHTSKYNVLTFLPINLFEQFQRVANAYFLFLLILQLIPEISSLSWFTTIVPLVLVLTITAVKDATDDFFRHKSDNQVNNRLSEVLINGRLQSEKWMNVKAGDIIKLENNQFVAADLLLLSSSEPHGLCYIETAELDGETNLKVRHALPVTSELGADISRLAEFDGVVTCEPPNNKLDKFTGDLAWKDNKYPLNNEKIILRGCVLRNSSWCFGMVIFAGPDTKLMQNSGRTKFKRTSIDRLMNTLVLWIFGFLVCMGIILAIGNSIWEHQVGDYFQAFLFRDEVVKNPIFSGFLTFWSYIIILNTVVPISLYVSVEVIRLGHSHFINWDRKMYYSKRETLAEARTTTLNEELGQIEYVFSDKTGTLTQNIMTFNKCSINGRTYGEIYDNLGRKIEINEKTKPVDFSFNPQADSKFQFYDHSLIESIKLGDPKVHEFFRLLALCHTVMPEEKNEGKLIYQVQSPDEGALVTAARNFGFIFKSRTPETITVEEMGKVVTYRLLAFLDFNNIRKRMSVIVQNPEGQIKLYCKGADTILFEKLHPSNEELMTLTSDHLSEFGGEGLRTLAIAYRDLNEEYFKEWFKLLEEASRGLDMRDERIAAAYEEIERDMMLLGATAIEDKLQDGVIETIASLSLANIKIWVLTGDKQETAMNIGYSCNMLTDDMNEVFVISGQTAAEVWEELKKAKQLLFERSTGFTNGYAFCEKLQELKLGSTVEETVTGDYALIINGHSLGYALEANLQNEFLEIACICKTVICCRVTPLQKAQVVELVKTHRKAVTLAIGDGANDISMIKSAHIGVGISGQEGMQAVLASDYSFAQFRYLQRLLLVHGRWSYFRMCKFLCYFFYKNFAFTLVHFWFGFFCGFSAQTVYDQWFITLFNIVYTSLPVLAMGIFDQDVSEQNSMDYPNLYGPGQLNLLFNKRKFFICTAHGVYTSFALFFIPYGVFYNVAGEDGKHITDYQSFAVTIATSLVIVVSVQIALDTSYWTVINHVFIWGSIAVYFSILFTMHSDGIFDIFPNQFPFVGNARHSLTQKSTWLVILLTTVVSVMPVITFRFLKVDLYPTLSDQVRQLQRAQDKATPLKSHKRQPRRTSSRRSGYAFAHQEGYGELITSGKNMRVKNLPTSGLGKTMYNSTSWIENLCKKTTDTVNSFSPDRTVKL